MTQEMNFLEIEKTSTRSHQTRNREIKRIIEALLFSNNEATPLSKLKEVIDTSYPVRTQEIKQLIEELGQEYRREGRSFKIDEIAGGYQLRTVEEMRPYVEKLYQDRRGEKLSRAATEVLAIVAHHQPITRREIEGIRGVDSSGTVASLLERRLIESVGHKEAPGRPVQFGITKRFLAHFGLKDLEELKFLD